MNKLLLVLMLLTTVFCLANEDLDGDYATLKSCASQWESHPFGKINKLTEYRTINSNVRVLGVGGETVDDKKTKKPQLILIKPSVSVLTKTTYRLLNPNGYYCFKGKVAVLAKTVIVANCKAHVVAGSGTEVLGSNSGNTNQGTTVLGKSQIERVNCP